jgi:hypothetical protein
MGQKIGGQENAAPDAIKEQQHSMDMLRAVNIAQTFVVDNGYTDLPVQDKSKVIYEFTDFFGSDIALRARKNTLEPKAYRAIRGGRTTDGWTVIFRYNPGNSDLRRVMPEYENHIRRFGRAVTMDSMGAPVRIEHQDFLLDFAPNQKEPY